MPLQLIIAPTVEPLTLDEIKAQLRIDTGNQEPAPDAPTAALAGAGAGNVNNGAHRYLVAFVTADGQTQAGVASAAVTVVDLTANGKIALTAIALGGSAVTSRKVYRTLAGGSTYFLLTTIADNTTTTYTDNTADLSLGVGAPTSNTTSDPILSRLRAAVRRSAEHELNRKLITQQWKLSLDWFPGRWRIFPTAWRWDGGSGRDGAYVPARYTHGNSELITLPFPSAQTIDSVKYYDYADVQQTLAEVTHYIVDKAGEPARIYPAYGTYWPDVSQLRLNAVEILFTVGYGVAAAVPEDVKTWMLLMIEHYYANRGASITLARGENIQALPFIGGLLDPYRLDLF